LNSIGFNKKQIRILFMLKNFIRMKSGDNAWNKFCDFDESPEGYEKEYISKLINILLKLEIEMDNINNLIKNVESMPEYKSEYSILNKKKHY
jgi:hypothetical protein